MFSDIPLYDLSRNVSISYLWNASFHIMECKWIDSNLMATLLAAVEGGSLTSASRKLGMPLATVSRKVSELETHLRTKLFNRTSRKLTLTDAGRSYVAACKKIFEDIGEAERAAKGEYIAPKGDLNDYGAHCFRASVRTAGRHRLPEGIS